MDTRIALKKNTVLKFYNYDQGMCLYTIEKELARGASCIVYEASYINNSGVRRNVRIKECYPFTLFLKRTEDGSLLPDKSDVTRFEERKRKMKEAFNLGNELFDLKGLTNFTANTVDIYELHNTIYIVTTYQEGTTLSDADVSSLKDCISVVKSIAIVISKLHKQGYLYLDLKPENIFTLTGTYELVQLFDFDSLAPMTAFQEGKDECEYKISYTKGFSALELKTGNLKKIGKHTDIYAIGAILFYLLFGSAPEAPDCEMDAEYAYTHSRYGQDTFQEQLYAELTEFFHNTLANFYLDRYQDVFQVITKLEEIEKLADTTIPYIMRPHIMGTKIFVGRQRELALLKQWSMQKNSDLLFVTGIGGIGKSSFVKNFLLNHTELFDTFLYLNFHHSLIETIADDKQFTINAITQNILENPMEYFQRKLSIAARLTQNQKTILVIDNYNGKNFEGLPELLKLGWKILIISRNRIGMEEYPSIDMTAIQDREELHTIFESYLRRSLEEDEYSTVDRILDQIQGHTLVLELIAKQMANSFLSISAVEKLISENGFSGIAQERISCLKDDVYFMDTIKNILHKLFDTSSMNIQDQTLLKAIAFFGTNGISIDIFSKIYGLETKDILNMLVMEGWISVEHQILVMHPVIMEIALSLKMSDVFVKTSVFIMAELKKMLKTDSETVLDLCEEFLNSCSRHKELTALQAYRELMFHVLCRMPRYREAYILSNAIRLTQNPGTLKGNEVIRLYDLISEIYEECLKLDQAYDFIRKAQPLINQFEDEHIKGQYQYLWVGYYDYKLNGNYAVENKEDARTLVLLLKALDKAIHYMKKSKHPDQKKLLAEYIRCKANIYIRSAPRKKLQISLLLNKATQLMKQENMYYSEFAGGYYLTMAWYYTYVEENPDRLSQYILKAYKVNIKLCKNPLDLIDNFMIPAANILFENDMLEDSIAWLKKGIQLCEENEEILPFARKKAELCCYLQEVQQFLL